MTTTASDTSQKLELLESRVAATIQRLGELNTRCQELTEQNSQMESELADFKRSNSELAQEVVRLKAEGELAPKRAVDDKKILYRIDKMLEKFGELQI